MGFLSAGIVGKPRAASASSPAPINTSKTKIPILPEGSTGMTEPDLDEPVALPKEENAGALAL
ncbi:hypothetical protein [Bradyrhizobium sp. SYSU BS000235]|uniref:hypothetical protein n=1 Tax=Bradyrhizobium sp. SYSU BS000235 TaxID=3411332 RepID=UPI003C78A5CC